jgi:hypothetical protein
MPFETLWLRQEEGVMSDLGLSVRPYSLGLAGPQLLGLSLADILRTEWPTN